MTLREIKKSITINTPVEKVWKVLLDEDCIEVWYQPFGEGLKANTDWQAGSKASFTDKKGDGIFGRIIEHIPYKKIAIEYDGCIMAGEEDTTSEIAIAMRGSQEIYTLEPSGNGTVLAITCEMGESYFDMMSAAWENALKQIKQLSEAGSK